MNFVKKTKLISFICVLISVIGSFFGICLMHKNYQEQSEKEVAAAISSYTVNGANYNTTTAARVFSSGNASNDDDVWVDVLYPKAIYLDKSSYASDSLQKAGYYFQYNAGGPGGSGSRNLKISDKSYGYWQDSQNANKTYTTSVENGITVSNSFDEWLNYGKATPMVTDSNITGWNTNSEIGDRVYAAIDIQLHPSVEDFSVKFTFNLQGTLKSTTNVGTYRFKPTQGNYVWFEWHHVNNGDTYFTSNVWRSSRTYKNGGTNKIASFPPWFIGYDLNSEMSIDLVVYDGSTLMTAINKLQNYIDDSYVQSVATAESIASARAKITEATTLLTTREKTQSDIDTMVNTLNNFKFNTKTINFIKDIHTAFGERTFAENITAATSSNEGISVWDFFNVDYTFNKGSDYISLNETNYPYGSWTTKNFYLPAGAYSFKFSAKGGSSGTPITRAGSTHNFDVISKTHVVKLNQGTYNNTTNGQGINVWCYIDVANNQTMPISSNNFTYTGEDYKIGGQYSQVSSNDIISPQFPEIASKLGSGYKYQYSIDGTTWEDELSIADAGSYQIQYRIINLRSSGVNTNLVQVSGALNANFIINKANIALAISQKMQPYGGDLPTQETLLGMVTDASDLYNLSGIPNNMDIAQLREKLGSMVELGLSGFNMTDTTANFAGGYTMTASSYKNMEGSEKSWEDNITITFKNNSNVNCYIVNPINLELNWIGETTSVYDGNGGKRPRAEIKNMSVPLKEGDIVEVGITAITENDHTPILVSGEAVNWGKYVVRVRLRDFSADDPDSAYLQNYTIVNPTCEFSITKRELTVEIKATSAVYGSATAIGMVNQWTDLTNGIEDKIEITGGSLADGQSADTVFGLIIDKTGRGGNAGVPTGGSYLNVGLYDISGMVINDNYEISFVGSESNGSSDVAISTFTVSKAKLNMNLNQIAPKRYNGQEQAISMTDSDIRGFFLHNTDYDIAHKTIYYSLTDNADFDESLTVKHVNVNESGEVIPYVVYYRVESDNYEDFGYEVPVSFNATITRLPIEVDIQRSTGIKYGTSGSKDEFGYPTSKEIKDACLSGEHGYFAIIDGERQSIDLSGTLEFYLTNAEEGKKLQAGSYTVWHRVKAGADDRLSNYNFIYNGVQVSQFVVERADLRFEWTVSDLSEWGTGDRPTYVYDDTPAEQMLTASGAVSGGKITIRPMAEDVYYGDVITPQVELRNGRAGSEAAFDRNVGDKVVYAHLLIGGGNIANYDLKTQWFEFEIVKRQVKVKLKGASFEYGTLSSAASSETGLGELSNKQKRWEYAEDNQYEFVKESHHRAYGTLTPAKATVDGQYVDVGKYPLYAGPLYQGQAEYDVIYGNYEVIFTGSWSETDGPNGDGTFNGENYVGKADIIEIFNADITNTVALDSVQLVYSGNAQTITSELFKTRLSNPNNNLIYNSEINAANAEIWFSGILASTSDMGDHEALKEGLPGADESDSAWAYRSGVSAEMTELGTYDMAIWIRNVKNYNDKVMGVYVQITPSNIIITLNGRIDAVYGDELYDDETLKDKVFDLVESINESGENGSVYDKQVVKEWIKSFKVVPANGASMTTINDNVGDYTIEIAERNAQASNFTLQFITNGGQQNENIIGIYHVNPRPLEISWSDWSYVYGEHVHTDIIINKVFESDDVYIDMECDVNITNVDGTNNGVYNKHARDKGSYNAEIVSISGANGTGAGDSTRKYTVSGMSETDKVRQITVEARPLTIKVKEQETHTYGDAITALQSLENYLYQTPTTYEIISGSLANNASMGINDNNNVKQILTIKISYAKPEDATNEYIPVGVYDIIAAVNASSLGANYDITFVFGDSETELVDGKYIGGFVVQAADITAARVSKELIVFDGKEHDITIREIGFLLQGDGKLADENVGDGDMTDGVKNKLAYTISYMQTTRDSTELPAVDDARWGTSWKVKDAGEYYNYIKVVAENHNPLIWKVSQTVAKVDVLVKVSATSITYGQEVPSAEMLSAALSPEYTFTYDGHNVVVEGFEDELLFKVVGQGGETELSGILNAGKYRVVCYTLEGNNNYNITYAEADEDGNKCNAEAFVVNKKQLTVKKEEFDYAGTSWQEKTTEEAIGDITATVYSYVYDGKVPELTVNAEGALDKDNITINKRIYRLDTRGEKVDTNANVGLYAVELSVAAGEGDVSNNYEIPQEETIYYRIERRVVEIEIGEKASADAPLSDRVRTYGVYKGNVPEGADSLVHMHNLNDDSNIFLPSDGKPVQLTVDVEIGSGKEYIPVGTYNFKAECTNNNYEIKVVESRQYIVQNATARVRKDSFTATYNGAPLNVDVKAWLEGTNEYGENMLELAGDVKREDIRIEYKVGDQYVDTLEINGSTGSQPRVVEYRLTAPNHAVVEATIKVNIDKASLVVKISNAIHRIYGEELLGSEEIYTEAGIYTNSDLAKDLRDVLTFSISSAAKNVGEYDLNYAFKPEVSADWFILSFENNCNKNAYVIDKRPIYLNWSEEELRYNGKEQIPMLTLNGVLATDTCSVVIEGEKGVNAGTYTIAAGSLSNSNYEISGNTSKTYTILPRIAQLMWTDQHLVFNGKERLPKAAVKNLVDPINGPCEVKVSGATAKAGNWEATAISLSNSNYELSKVESEYKTTFVIEQATLSVDWKNEIENLVYSGEKQYPLPVINGDVYGEDCNLVLSITKGGVESEAKDAGNYHIKVLGIDNPNFKLSNLIEKDYVIGKKEIIFSWLTDGLVYTGAEQLPKCQAEGIVSSEEINDVFVLSGANVNAGKNYTAVATLKSDNYILTNGVNQDGKVMVSAEYEIGKADNGLTIEYERPNWAMGEIPSEETMPEAKFGEITIKYYTDEALTNEYTGKFDENTPQGKYYVVVTTESSENYNGQKLVYSFEVKANNSVLLYGISIVMLVALIAAIILICVAVRKKVAAKRRQDIQ